MNSKIKRDDLGRFSRTVDVWTPENWDNGYYDNKGRFRVYRPDYPRAYLGGYVLRYHVVWWLHYGVPHKKGTELHHIDGSKSNDRVENLAQLTNSEHQKIHKQKLVTLVCEHCKKEFKKKEWMVNSGKGKFCTSSCYAMHPKENKRIKQVCIQCGTEYEIIKSKSSRKFCSHRCSADYNWSIRHAYIG